VPRIPVPPSEVPAEVVASPQVIVALSSGQTSPVATFPVNDRPSVVVMLTLAVAAAGAITSIPSTAAHAQATRTVRRKTQARGRAAGPASGCAAQPPVTADAAGDLSMSMTVTAGAVGSILIEARRRSHHGAPVNFSLERPGSASAERQTSPPLRDAGTTLISFDQPVADGDRMRLMLELEVGSDPIVGSLQSGDKHAEFSGWVGLATALEEAMRTTAALGPHRSTPTDAHSSRLPQLP
jgi:hypothetical protein